MTGELKRVALEMGSGVALHSGDYTKAAVRAVEDAVRNSSLTMFRSLGIDPQTMHIDLHLAARQPESIDLDTVCKVLPFGTVTPKVIKGGLDVIDVTTGKPCVVVNAGVIVRVAV